MRAVLLACLTVALAQSASAQATPATPGAAGAEAAVEAYIASFAAGNWPGAIAQLDPEEVAEFAELLGMIGDEVPGFTPDKTASPAKAVAAFFETVLASEPIMDEALSTLDGAIIGTVLESDSLAHVVGRSSFTMLGGDIGAVNVTTARWTGRRWTVTFGARMSAIRQALAARAASDG